MIVKLDYKIHNKSKLLKKLETRRIKKDHQYIILDVDLPNFLEGTVVYNDQPFSCDVKHLEFYAHSIGWENFTSTGYYSHFFFSNEIFDQNNILENFYTLCQGNGMDVYNPKKPAPPEPKQFSLF